MTTKRTGFSEVVKLGLIVLGAVCGSGGAGLYTSQDSSIKIAVLDQKVTSLIEQVQSLKNSVPETIEFIVLKNILRYVKPAAINTDETKK